MRVVISGYRYYLPEIGRWGSRDPISEKGGYNLYVFCFNNAIHAIDVLGEGVRIGPIFNDDGLSKPTKEDFIQWALSFDVTIGLAAGATYDNAVRVLYDEAEIKLLKGKNQLVSRGILSAEEGARLYVEERNKLVRIFRNRSGPVGKYVANAIKPLDKLPDYQTLLEQKGSAEAILESAKANKSVNRVTAAASKAGKVCVVISVGISLANVALAEEGQHVRVAVNEVGQFAGAIAGAWAMGETLGAGGTALGGPWVGIPAAFVGVITGSYYGSKSGGYYSDLLYDAIVED